MIPQNGHVEPTIRYLNILAALDQNKQLAVHPYIKSFLIKIK